MPLLRASGSVGGARPCQGRGRGFESRLALVLRGAENLINRGSAFFEWKKKRPFWLIFG